jgi:tRNA-dihydrouridine synthase 1
MVKAMVAELTVPVFCKIRLLATVAETIAFVRRLKDAGAALVAVHGRYPTWLTAGGDSSRGSATHRRDGAAHLDQVAAIRASMPPHFPILSNGNVRSGEDVVDNLRFTKCDGVMTAEGILDDPSIFATAALGGEGAQSGGGLEAAAAQAAFAKQQRVAEKAAAQEALESARASGGIVEAKKEGKAAKAPAGLEVNQLNKIKSKPELLLQLDALPQEPGAAEGETAAADGRKSPAVLCVQRPCKRPKFLPAVPAPPPAASSSSGAAAVAPSQLVDKLSLASEYLDCVDQYPASAPLSTVIFHVRRIARSELNSYQLMQSMNRAESVKAVRDLINCCHVYQSGKAKFVFDPLLEEAEREAAERKKREEGKRKAFEARMVRKAKREGKEDLSFYLKTGLTPPSKSDIVEVQSMSEADRMAAWKQRFGQHCMAYHCLGAATGCQRDRSCAFLHADALVTAAGETSGSATAEGEPTWLNENNE